MVEIQRMSDNEYNSDWHKLNTAAKEKQVTEIRILA
jgi:hypothetical protein